MKIPIRCKGNKYLPYTELKEFQGGLKKISKENLLKLRALILKHGWIAPVFVWNETEIIDGHGRLLALKGLLKDGYEIDDIPVVDIEANSRKEAAEILLSINSHFQNITDEGLKEYMENFEIHLEDLSVYVLPDIDLGKFAAGFMQESKEGGEKKKVTLQRFVNVYPSSKKGNRYQIPALYSTKKSAETAATADALAVACPVIIEFERKEH